MTEDRIHDLACRYASAILADELSRHSRPVPTDAFYEFVKAYHYAMSNFEDTCQQVQDQ